ncbi:MAG: creatininase family protein [Beijerinckiaceae bacterium]
MVLPSRYWIDLTTEEFRTLPMRDCIAVLPVAAVEQHGPHLPVGVDTMIAEGYVATVIPKIPADIPVLFLPTQAIGKSNEHLSFPGTLTLSAETVIRAWTEIGESVHRAGVRKIIFVNSHGGNIAPMDIVARELRVRHGMIAVTCSWHRLGYPDGLFSADEMRLGIHGGEIETSLMLAFQEKRVAMGKAKNFVPKLAAYEKQFAVLRGTQPVGIGWMSEDLNPDGAMGNAAAADKAKGLASAAFGAEAFIKLLRDVQAFERD